MRCHLPILTGAVLGALCCACTGPAVRPRPPGPTPVSAALKATLKIPPVKGAAAALEQLRAQAGHCEATWLRIQYLLDLLDAARLRAAGGGVSAPPGAAHALLWKALALPGEPGRGRLATGQVIQALQAQLRGADSACRENRANMADAHALLGADLAPRTDAAEALRLVVVYKKIARSGSPLSPNARLRLVDWCLSAFRLASGGAPALQHARINQCLFPLYDADPGPYFAAEPAARPPDPPWNVLQRALQAELALLVKGRLGSLAAAIARDAEAFFGRAAATLPTPLNLRLFLPPRDDRGLPWDRTPIVLYTSQGYYVGGRAVLPDDKQGLQQAIAERLRGDRRGRVTLVAAADDPATMVSHVGRAARLAGARTLALATVKQVALKAPAGDVQSAVFGDRPVDRLQEVPLSLLLLSARASTPLARDRPRGQEYNAAAAKNALGVRLSRGSYQVFSRHGVLPPVHHARLQQTLQALRKGYPDDTSLVLVPGAGASYQDLAEAAGMARRYDGQPLFPGLALSSPGRTAPSEGDLSPLLRILTAATVAVSPAHSRALPLLLRRCYLDTLRAAWGKKKKYPQGKLVLAERKGKLRIAGGKLRHGVLRKCIKQDVLTSTTAPAGIRLDVAFRIGSP